MEENQLQPPPVRRLRIGSLLWPILLILIGTILLLESLNIFDESLWDILWRFWPVFLIALGLDGLLRRKEIFGPVFAIGLGGIFILANFGLLAWNSITTLLRLWPLLIVAAGVDIIFGRKAVWLSTIWVVVIFGLLGGALWMADAGPLRGETLTSENISQPMGDVSRAEVVIAPAVGQLSMAALVDSTDLIAGQAEGGETRWARSDYRIQGDKAFYSLQSRNPAVFPRNTVGEWQLNLTSEIPIDLETSMGAGEIRLELDQLLLSRLEVNQGVGNLHIVLPAGNYKVEINQAIGQLIVEIPAGAAVRIAVSRAISSLSVPAGFEQRDGYYYSSNYQGAAETIELDLSQAIGDITIRYQR